MKKIILIISVTFILTSCYTRIGDLTMMANRSVDCNKDYILLQRNAEGKIKASKGNDLLDRVVDETTEKYNGEYLMNVKIFVKGNGKKIKIIGDVWGDKSAKPIDVKKDFKEGDLVAVKILGKIYEGVILGLKEKKCIVEYTNSSDYKTKKEVSYDDLTKIKKD
jgi:hypothetical protein